MTLLLIFIPPFIMVAFEVDILNKENHLLQKHKINEIIISIVKKT